MGNLHAYFYWCKFNFDLRIYVFLPHLFSFTESAISSTLSAVIMF
jgi:hypothetical protein